MGKQHGSLSRAGKVKGSTPKVDVDLSRRGKVNKSKRRGRAKKECFTTRDLTIRKSIHFESTYYLYIYIDNN